MAVCEEENRSVVFLCLQDNNHCNHSRGRSQPTRSDRRDYCSHISVGSWQPVQTGSVSPDRAGYETFFKFASCCPLENIYQTLTQLLCFSPSEQTAVGRFQCADEIQQPTLLELFNQLWDSVFQNTGCDVSLPPDINKPLTDPKWKLMKSQINTEI